MSIKYFRVCFVAKDGAKFYIEDKCTTLVAAKEVMNLLASATEIQIIEVKDASVHTYVHSQH